MKKISLLTLPFIILALGLGACSRKAELPPEAAEPAAAADESGYSAVLISSAAEREAGITVVKAGKVSFPETFQAVGRVLQDTQSTHHIPAGVPGRLQSLSVALGQQVAAGTVLAVLRSDSGEEVAVSSKYKGIVSAIHASAGDSADENTFLFTVTEVDPLWGVLDIHEINLGKIHAGQKAAVRTAAYPGRVFTGAVTFVSPEVDPVSRTVKARVSIDNPAGLLKFGMFIDAAVETGAYFRGMLLPSSAVQSGSAGTFVFIKKAEGEFLPVPVSCGLTRAGKTEITGGLSSGEEVVVEGAFLLKSEMMKRLIEGE